MNPTKFKQLVAEVPEYRRRLYHRQGRIANQVRAFLDELGKNQVWLSNESGVAEPVLSRVMMGTSNLTLETIAKLESVFKKDIQLTQIEYAERVNLLKSVRTESWAVTPVGIIVKQQGAVIPSLNNQTKTTRAIRGRRRRLTKQRTVEQATYEVTTV